MEVATIQSLVTLSALVLSTGTIIWHNGRTEGKRQAREDDMFRRMEVAENWQQIHGATKEELEAVQGSFQDAVKSILDSVNIRMSGVESQVKELRTYMMARNHAP
jgi:hypothetical protein